MVNQSTWSKRACHRPPAQVKVRIGEDADSHDTDYKSYEYRPIFRAKQLSLAWIQSNSVTQEPGVKL